MTGSTVTQAATASAAPAGTDRHTSCTPSRAARELGVKRSEFDLAVHLGRIRTVPGDAGGGRRVGRDEIERIRSAEDFPRGFRSAVRVVGTTEGAALMEVTKARFTRLARLGLLVPVRFYVNRYRTVVWLYLADELHQFAADGRNARLLKGRTPEGLRGQLDEGLDLRPRNWRGRDLGCLLRQADDPWARAAAVASLLDTAEVPEVVTDPYERSHLRRFRPVRQLSGSPGSPAAQLAEEIMTAADPDEIEWLRADLADAVATARRQCSAPRPAALTSPARVRTRAAEAAARSARAGAPPAPAGTPSARTGTPSARTGTPPARTGTPLARAAPRSGGERTLPRSARPAAAQRHLTSEARRQPTYRARKSPSCTTDTSMRPSVS